MKRILALALSILTCISLLLSVTVTPLGAEEEQKYQVEGESSRKTEEITLADGTPIGIAYKDIISSSLEGEKVGYDLQYAALKAYTNGEDTFTIAGESYQLDEFS